MRIRMFLPALLALAGLLALPGLAAADSYEEHYTLDIQMQDFMDRLYDVMTRPEWLGQYDEVRGMADLLRQFGMFDLSGVDAQYHVMGGQASFEYGKSFAGIAPESYMGRVLALPNSAVGTAGFINPDDYVLYLGMNNLPQQAMIYLDEFQTMLSEAQPGSSLDMMLDGETAEVSQALAMLDAFDVETQVNEVLAGDVSLVLFDTPALEKLHGDFQPGDVHAALLVGLKDDARLTQLAAMFAGQAGLAPMTGDLAGWTGYHIPDLPLGGIIFNDSVLIASPNIYDTLGRLNYGRTGLATPECQCYFDLNLGALHSELVSPLMGMLMSESDMDLEPTMAASAYLVGLPEESALGHLTAHSTYHGDSYRSTMHMNTAVANYLFYYLGVGLSAMAQSEMGGGQDFDIDMNMEAAPEEAPAE